MSPSPEQWQKTVEKWSEWFKELSLKGHLVNIGHPLEKTGAVVSGAERTVKDGPFAEVKDVIGGFSIIQAEDQTDAAGLAKGCPILEVGGSVEVRPVRKLSM